MTMIQIQSQYESFKKQYPDALLMMRTGEWYALYNEDADKAARSLGLIKNSMVGTLKYVVRFPQNALNMYLPKLVRDGYRICICDEPEMFT